MPGLGWVTTESYGLDAPGSTQSFVGSGQRGSEFSTSGIGVGGCSVSSRPNPATEITGIGTSGMSVDGKLKLRVSSDIVLGYSSEDHAPTFASNRGFSIWLPPLSSSIRSRGFDKSICGKVISAFFRFHISLAFRFSFSFTSSSSLVSCEKLLKGGPKSGILLSDEIDSGWKLSTNGFMLGAAVTVEKSASKLREGSTDVAECTNSLGSPMSNSLSSKGDSSGVDTVKSVLISAN